MENSKMNRLKVGIFLSIGIIAVMTTIFMLGANKAFFTSYAHIFSEFENVQGLARGSVVSLSGIVVGNIEGIDFVSEKNLLRVDMKVEKAYLKRIFKGSQVDIRTQGALGDKFIYIIPGNPAEDTVQDLDTLPIAKSTDLLNVLSERGGETEKIFDIINEVYKLTKTLNHDNQIASTISNIHSASQDFKQISEKSAKLISELNTDIGGKNSVALQLKTSMDKMNSILTKIDRGDGTLGALINDPSLHEQLKNLVGGSTRKNHVKSLLRTSIEKSEE